MRPQRREETHALSWHGHVFRLAVPGDRQGFVCESCGHIVTLCDERAGIAAAKQIDEGTTALRDDDITILSDEKWRDQSSTCAHKKLG